MRIGGFFTPAWRGGFLPLLDSAPYLWYNIITVREQEENKSRARKDVVTVSKP